MDVSMASITNPKKVVRFLIDDVAFVEDVDCAQAQADMRAELVPAGAAPAAPPPPITDPAAAPAQ
jgi:hypothetical protein